MPAFDLIVFTLALVIVGRCTVPGHGLSWPGTYEAAAHIWVGWLLAVCFRKKTEPKTRWTAIAALTVATVFETVMFLTRKP